MPVTKEMEEEEQVCVTEYLHYTCCTTSYFFPPLQSFPIELAEGGELTQSYHETSSVDFCGGTLDPLRVTVLLCVYTCTVVYQMI